MSSDYINSPLNYIGGKKRLLDKILPHFPPDIETFYDMFCGGGVVGMNALCKKVHLNDICSQIISLYRILRDEPTEKILSMIDKRVSDFKLSDSNVDGYMELRDVYNKGRNPLDLFVLIAYSFNNQIRFNSAGEFNMPFGKDRSWFNPVMRDNLVKFSHALQNNDVSFSSSDFEDFDFSIIGKNDFVYLDPPYLISQATYNAIWNEDKENKLLSKLTELNDRGVKFALSNVMENNGETNDILKEWSKSGGFNVYHMYHSYANSSYHRKERTCSDEVLITNYRNENVLF